MYIIYQKFLLCHNNMLYVMLPFPKKFARISVRIALHLLINVKEIYMFTLKTYLLHEQILPSGFCFRYFKITWALFHKFFVHFLR